MEKALEMLDQYPDTTIVFGDSCFTDFEYLIRKLGTKKIAVFTGRGSADRCGAWMKLLASQTYTGVELVRFLKLNRSRALIRSPK